MNKQNSVQKFLVLILFCLVVLLLAYKTPTLINQFFGYSSLVDMAIFAVMFFFMFYSWYLSRPLAILNDYGSKGKYVCILLLISVCVIIYVKYGITRGNLFGNINLWLSALGLWRGISKHKPFNYDITYESKVDEAQKNIEAFINDLFNENKTLT